MGGGWITAFLDLLGMVGRRGTAGRPVSVPAADRSHVTLPAADTSAVALPAADRSHVFLPASAED